MDRGLLTMIRRSLEALLSTGTALVLTVNKRLTQYINGLADGAPEDFKAFAFLNWTNLFPHSTNDVQLWANQFGLFPSEDEDAQRKNIDAAWKSSGGQGLDYFQGVLDAAGFGVFVHASLDPETGLYRNPLDWLEQAPNIGVMHSGADNAHADGEEAYASNLQEGGISDYIVNQNLTFRPQPPIVDDEDNWPFWIYVGGEVFGDRAEIPESRELEFQTLILSLFPGNYWIGLFIDKEVGSEILITEAGEDILTESGEALTT